MYRYIDIDIQQGDSSILFNLVMDEIIKDVKNIETGYNMENNIIQILYYIDNEMLFTK